MSIIVDGIKMPRSCADCRFMVGRYCYASDDVILDSENLPTYERAKGCPLQEVEELGWDDDGTVEDLSDLFADECDWDLSK